MAIVNGYCTLAQIRSELGYQSAETGDDPKLELAVAAASRQIDGYCGQRFWQDGSVVDRVYVTECLNELELCDTDDGAGISTTTGLVVKLDTDDSGTFETTLTIDTDFYLEPRNAADRVPVWPYTTVRLTGANYWFTRSAYARPTVQISAKFGWPAVPDDITKACLVQASQLFKAKDAVFGGVALGDAGATMFVRASLNQIAAALCAPYRRPAIG